MGFVYCKYQINSLSVPFIGQTDHQRNMRWFYTQSSQTQTILCCWRRIPSPVCVFWTQEKSKPKGFSPHCFNFVKEIFTLPYGVKVSEVHKFQHKFPFGEGYTIWPYRGAAGGSLCRAIMVEKCSRLYVHLRFSFKLIM